MNKELKVIEIPEKELKEKMLNFRNWIESNINLENKDSSNLGKSILEKFDNSFLLKMNDSRI